MFRIEVTDKKTKKLTWTEPHKTKDSALRAVRLMKEHTFNPDFFHYEIKEETVK